jgi:hypothetical protein
MRAYRLVGLFCVAAVVPIVWSMIPRAQSLEPEPVLADSAWKPTAAEVAMKVGRGAGGSFNDSRHLRFGNLFKNRYREKQYAVGLKFESDKRIKAMFAPNMPRWYMAHVAVKALDEARHVFQRDFVVDIYETYITAPMRKLGEVHSVADRPQVSVLFDPRFALEPRRR